jgi:MoaA/NifB/PqqE/SkfB family radical SAM enzyme
VSMVQTNEHLYAQVEEDGRLVLPPELVSRFGVKAGTRIRVDEDANGFKVVHPTRLAKLYIEPTNECNLTCRTCVRNVWQEPMGKMSDITFDRVIEGLRDFLPPPTVFFGGLGEPLHHPQIVEMVASAKQLGTHVELITNGTQLSPDLSRKLLEAGIDVLWVSIDGATPESYADIRLGAELPRVIENVTEFYRIVRTEGHGGGCVFIPRFTAQLGIEFVAMKRNIGDLPAVLRLGRRLGAKRFMVTNVMPYTAEMREEVLYTRVLWDSGYPRLSLPRIEESEITHGPLCGAMDSLNLTLAMHHPQMAVDRCPFIEGGAGAVGWDGSLSPCLPLLHSHVSFPLVERERFSRRWTIGNVTQRSLAELWHAPEHVAFRERVQTFDFSPCTRCGGCELMEKNEEDCFANAFPTCGGCLWAQGVVQCP